MKKHILNVAILATMVVVGCTNSLPEALPQANNSERVIAESPYNEAFDGVAQTVSKAMVLSSDFRQVVKDLSLQKFDGDYDIMLSTLGEQTVSDYTSTKGLTGPITVAQMFDELFPADTKTLSPEEILATIAEMYPLMQIAVPVHAEDWELGYIPTVVFLDDNYVDTVTEYVKGYNADGEEVWVDAINEPEVPIIVISENERGGASQCYGTTRVDARIGEPIVTASNLTATFEGINIVLRWQYNNGTPRRTLVYASIGESGSFSYLSPASGTSFTYRDVAPNTTYRFYLKVVSPDGQTVTDTDVVSITSANTTVDPVAEFSATPINSSQVLLAWNQSSLNTHDYIHIYRRDLMDASTTGLGQLVASISNSNIHQLIDENVESGKKYRYTAFNAKNGCASNYKYDTIWKPYRNCSQADSVYIKTISFNSSSLSDIESWVYGAPELRITTHTVPGESTTASTRNSNKLLYFDSRSNCSKQFNSGNFLFTWLPQTTYDCLTIHMAEWDLENTNKTITYSVEVGVKASLGDNIEATSTASVNILINSDDKNIGLAHTRYYEDPHTTMSFDNYGFKVTLSDTNAN